MKENEQTLDFQLELTHCSEIATDDASWAGDEVERIDDVELQEMMKADDEPYFVDVTALYEGVSGNGRTYTTEAVKSCVKAMLNVNMYKGHVNPADKNWVYRSPVGKIVASRLSTIDIDGRQVLAAKGKAYITSDDPKLRRDITRKMAGPVSILGAATAHRDIRTGKRTIVAINNPLKSVDFCNPGTNGLPEAGVNFIVREMSGNDDLEPQIERDTEMGKMTKATLLTEHPDLIEEIVGEQMDDKFAALAAEKAKLTEFSAEHKGAIEAKDEEIAEMKTELEAVKAEAAELQSKLAKQEHDLLTSQLVVFKAEAVAEMKADEDLEGKEKLVDLAAAQIDPVLVDGDLDKSKVSFKATLKKAVDTNVAIFEMAGGSTITEADEKTTSKKTGNKKVTSNSDADRRAKLRARILSPELLGETA